MGFDISPFVKDPQRLVELCQEVVVRLGADSTNSESAEDLAAMETQLREIAKTIERLEKAGVPIPDVLRAEKTRLAAVVGNRADTTESLERLAKGLDAALRDIRIRLLRRKPTPSLSSPHHEKANLERISHAVLRDSIIRALQSAGGKARIKQIFDLMGAELHDQFQPADLNWLDTRNCYSWQRAAQNQHDQMVKEGLLRGDSVRGIWVLNEADS